MFEASIHAVRQKTRVVSALVLLLFGTASQGEGQVRPADEPNTLAGSWTASIENDTFIRPWLPPFVLESHDRQYTNGLHFMLDRDGDNPWLFGLPMGWGRSFCIPYLCSRAADQEVEYLVRARLAQTSHTPDTLESFTVYQGERPYSGLLFGELELHFAELKQAGVMRLTSFGALLGLWGHASGAESAQAGFHTIQGHRDPKGWESTNDFGVALQATYRSRWSRAFDLGKGLQFAGEPEGELALGTPMSQIGGSVTLRFGNSLRPFAPAILPVSLVPLLATPGMPALRQAPGPDKRFELFVQGRGRYVMGNGFIQRSGLARHEPLVAEVITGVRLEAWPWAVTYAAVLRSPEISAAMFRSKHDYGVLQLTRFLEAGPPPHWTSKGLTALLRRLEIAASLGSAWIDLPGVTDPGGDRHSMRVLLRVRLWDWLTISALDRTGSGLFTAVPKPDGSYTDNFLKLTTPPLRGIHLRAPATWVHPLVEPLQLSYSRVDGTHTIGECYPRVPRPDGEECGKEPRDLGQGYQIGLYYGYEIAPGLRAGPDLTFAKIETDAGDVDLTSLTLRLSWLHR